MSDVVEVKEVGWNKNGSEAAYVYKFFLGTGKADYQGVPAFFVHKEPY
jgi:hypothetical protein